IRATVTHEYPDARDLARAVRDHFGAASRLGAIQTAVTLVLLTDVVFFLGLRALGLKLVGITFLYPLLFWLLVLQYQWAVLVEQRSPATAVVKKSVLLALDNFGFTLLLGLATAAITLICLSTRIGFPLLWAGTLGFLQTAATRE